MFAMEMLSIYNTPIKLEEGDLIAVDEVKRRLWIRVGDKLYKAIEPVDKLPNLEGILYVNSAGLHSRDESALPALEWKKYIPSAPNKD